MRVSDFLSAYGHAGTIDLGGGFGLLEDDVPGGSVIVATALVDTGARGYASPVTVDARLDADALDWIAASGLAPDRRLCSLDQVHGSVCKAADDAQPVADASAQTLARLVGTDAVWTRSPDDVLIVRTADCAAIWLVDPEHGHLAMVHAGWRGAAAGIVRNTIDALVGERAHADFLVAAVGPHIGPCCFEVGPEVARLFADIDGAISPGSSLTAPRARSDSMALNLSAVLVEQLRSAGLAAGAIHVATACTRCFQTEGGAAALHSYRRNGSGGPLMGSIGFLER